MVFMNAYEIEEAQRLFDDSDTYPNLHVASLTLLALMDWADQNSDGWCVWPVPSRSSQALQQVLHEAMSARYTADPADITPEVLQAAVRPVRRFLATVGADCTEVLP